MDAAYHHHRRISMTAIGLLALSLLAPSSALADQPFGGREGSTDPGPAPLTPKEQATLGLKLARLGALNQETVEAGAITPESVPCEPGQPPPCIWPRPTTYTLATRARHQHRSFYCGPATVQVVSNYTWGYSSTSECGAHCSTTNKYGQHNISTDWTLTDLHGETYVGDLKDGLNAAAVKPAGFTYLYWADPTWAEFHSAIQSDTWWWHMPLAARVDPKDDDSIYSLYSWRNVPAGEYGHYIALRGYSGDAQSSAFAYYNDSSGGVDEHTGVVIYGDTGAFSDYSNTVWRTMKNNTGGGSYYFFW